MKKSFQTNSVRLLNSEHIFRGNINCLDAVGFQPCHEPLILLFISSVGVFIIYMRQPHTALMCTNRPFVTRALLILVMLVSWQTHFMTSILVTNSQCVNFIRWVFNNVISYNWLRTIIWQHNSQ